MARVMEYEQGSLQWHIDRAGLITASKVVVIRKLLANGEYSAAAKKYAFQLAWERIAKYPLDDTFETVYMKRGKRLEVDARIKHEILIDDLIVEVGLVISDCGRYGASADGLIGNYGGAEYKCFTAVDSLEPIVLENDLAAIMDQMQMNMWLTDRLWWQFGLYTPSLECVGRDLKITPVERDDAYIASMVEDLERFDQLVEQYKEKIIAAEYNSVDLKEFRARCESKAALDQNFTIEF